MLVIVSFALVLVAAVTLVIGLLQSGLGLIYLSIGSSVTAGVVLAVAYWSTRPQPEALAAGPAPLRAPHDSERLTRLEQVTESPTTAPVPSVPGVEEGPVFPIADYDDLRVSEILPLLDQLERDELDVVRAREAATKERGTVLERIDQLVGASAGGAWQVREDDWAPEPSGPVFPIADYDDLRVAEIMPLLDELDADELQMVRDEELAGKARTTILDVIDSALGIVPETEPAADEAPAATRAPSRKRAPAKRRAAKKRAPAKKRAAKKKAPAKKRAAKKKAPAKKRAAKKRAAG